MIASAAAVLGQRPTPSPQPDNDVVKISTSLVQFDVTVVDSKGKIVSDLRPDEIEIFENGKKQKITNFSFVSSGRPVTRLNADKKSSVDMIPVPTAELRPEQVRRTIALVVDDLSLSFERATYTRRALRKFVDEQMLDGDLVAIIRTGSGIGSMQQFTSDKAMLIAAIERVRWNPLGSGGFSAFAPLEPTFAELTKAAGGQLDNDEAGGTAENVQKSFESFRTGTYGTGTLGSLRFIVSGMGELPGRKSVIFFSEGWPMLGRDEHGFTESTSMTEFMRRLVDLANRSSVVFYTIDSRGLVYTGMTAADKIPLDPRAFSAALTARSNQLFDTQAPLAYLAKETGGIFHRHSNDLPAGVRNALEDQSYYLLGYEPDADTFDPKGVKYNKIDFKINRPGLTARHRSGFFNVAESQSTKPASGNETPATQLLTAIKSPFVVNDISLRLNALFGSDGSGSFVRSLLHVDAKDLKFTDEADGSKKVVFNVFAASFGDNGAPVDQIQKTYTLNVKPSGVQKIRDEGFVYFFTMPVNKPGAYQYRVAIRDAQGGKIGTANQFIQIPNVKNGRLTASSIILESLSTHDWAKLMDPNGGTTGSSSEKDTALRRVKLGSVLRYGFEVYNAKLDAARKPSLQSRIRVFRDGDLVLDGQPMPVDLTEQIDMKRVQISGALNLLKDMQPGDYILQVIVTDTLAKKKEQVTAQHIQFEVVP